jgi:hypothetical protein
MLDKRNIFIIFSILFGFIISYYYNRKFNKTFILLLIIISLIFYIIFYYLGNIKSKENYDNYYNNNFINNKFVIIPEEHNQEEGDILFNIKNLLEEENHTLEESKIIEEESKIIEEESKKLYEIRDNLLEEEVLYKVHNLVKEKHNESTSESTNESTSESTNESTSESTSQSTSQSTKDTIEEEIHTLHKPNINKFVMNPVIPNNATGYTPLNINISYNSQNSVNELDNNEKNNEDELNNIKELKKKIKSKNLGDFNNERIHTNSDWIYGSNAWTNEPDYYIPDKYIRRPFNEIPQPLNELINSKKYKEKTEVCPLMVNTPWTEYKSGDSEPEPYNL